jgi:N-acetylated-alpha-linked acidic dipeptidase
VRFGDPDFAYGVVEAQTAGHVMLRMADAQVLPLQFAGLASTVGDYSEQLHKLVDEKRRHASELATLLEQNAFALATDPTRPVLAPARERAVPQVDFTAMDAAVARLRKSAQAYDAGYRRLLAAEVRLSAAQRVQLDGLLQGMEQKLTDPRGLPGREWFKHFIYAPGALTGYGVKTLPGVREAIDEDRWPEANEYAGITAQVLNAYCDQLEQATRLLNGS